MDFWSVDKSQDPLVFFAITVVARCSDKWLCICCQNEELESRREVIDP